MRIGLIHATIHAVAPIVDIAEKKYPDMTILNFVNENLLDHANRVGGVDAFGEEQFRQLFDAAMQAELDGIIIACTLYSSYAEKLQRNCSIPVIGIDEPMIRRCVEEGTHVGIVATTAASGPSAERKIRTCAERMGKEITVSQEIVTKAMDALKAGNVEEHNRLIAEAVHQLQKKGCDRVVLAQITMACALDKSLETGMVVLSSPDTGLEYMHRRVEESGK